MYYASINITINLLTAAILIVIITYQLMSPYKSEFTNKLFITALLFNISALFSDTVAWLVDGVISYGILNWSSNFTLYLFEPASVFVMFLYAVVRIVTDYKVKWIIFIIIISIFCLYMAFLIMNFFTGHIFYVNDNNHFFYGPYYLVALVMCLIIFVTAVAIIMSKIKSIGRNTALMLALCYVLPISTIVINIIDSSILIAYFGVGISMLIIFTNTELIRARSLKEKEVEITESRIAITLSQIQPHFIYNSLATIKYLCMVDPKSARDATVEFSDYLRVNLDSLTMMKPIPFTKELIHVKNYLSLEKRRYEAKLNIIFDIKNTDFYVPPLCIQPLVENAVRYGIVPKKSRGTIKICTSSDKSHWIIKIIDDGVGFTYSYVKMKNEKSHLGLRNVSFRIREMCHGQFLIKSSLGIGTCIKIRIPKSKSGYSA